MSILIEERHDTDAPSADWRVMVNGEVIGYLSDLGLDEADDLAGKRGFQAFSFEGTYVGTADTTFAAAEIVAKFRSTVPEPPHCRHHIQFRSDCEQCVSEREFA